MKSDINLTDPIRKRVLLSLIHISEPTSRYAISYADICLK